MLDPVLKNPWVQALGALVALVLVLLLAYLLSPVLIPLLLAFIAAYLLDPVVDFFERRKIPRGATIAVMAVLGVLLLFTVPFLLVSGVISEAEQLAQATAGEGRFEEWLDRAIDALALDEFVKYMDWVDPEVEDPDVIGVLAEKTGEWIEANAVQFLQAHRAEIAGAGQRAGTTIAQVFRSLGRGVVGIVVFVANFALFAFVAGYLLKDYDSVIGAAKRLVPPKHRERTFDIAGKIDKQITSFLRGQLMVCVCLGVLYGIGFLIAGVPFWFLVAPFGAIAGFIPYLGVVMTAVAALFLTLLEYGLDWHLIVVIATIAVAQALEGNVLTPKIVGDQVGLNPVWVILAVLVFGNFLGFLGLLIAVPLAAGLKVLVVEGVEYYKRSSVFGEDASSGGGSAAAGEGAGPDAG